MQTVAIMLSKWGTLVVAVAACLALGYYAGSNARHAREGSDESAARRTTSGGNASATGIKRRGIFPHNLEHGEHLWGAQVPFEVQYLKRA